MNTRAPHEIAMMQDNDDGISWTSADSNPDIIPYLSNNNGSGSNISNTTNHQLTMMGRFDGHLWNGLPISFHDPRSLVDSFSSIESDLSTASTTTITTTNNNRKTKRRLPPAFRPTNYSVIFGRGVECFNATGNRRFRATAQLFLAEYAEAKSKSEKSAIVSKLVEMVRESSPEGAFVRYEGNHWWEVSDAVAREKVGAQLRDLLHTKYRSSTKAKLEKRKQNKVKAKIVASIQSQTSTSISHDDNPLLTGIDSTSSWSPFSDTRPVATIEFPQTNNTVNNTKYKEDCSAEPISLSEDFDASILTAMSSFQMFQSKG